MNKQHFTFAANGRAIFVAITDSEDATSRLMVGEHRSYVETLTEHGRPLLDRGAVLSMRPSLPGEVAEFDRLGAATVAAGRIDEDDVRDGYPLFLINCIDPNFPEQDVNTSLRHNRMACWPANA